jgi:RimJ/RimL family protein N-acetyltransferase
VARALTTAAFSMSGIEEVHIHSDEANVASAAIPRRLGFRLARVVDHEVTAPGEVGRHMEWTVGRQKWLAAQAAACARDHDPPG